MSSLIGNPASLQESWISFSVSSSVSFLGVLERLIVADVREEYFLQRVSSITDNIFLTFSTYNLSPFFAIPINLMFFGKYFTMTMSLSHFQQVFWSSDIFLYYFYHSFKSTRFLIGNGTCITWQILFLTGVFLLLSCFFYLLHFYLAVTAENWVTVVSEKFYNLLQYHRTSNLWHGLGSLKFVFKYPVPEFSTLVPRTSFLMKTTLTFMFHSCPVSVTVLLIQFISS